MICLQCDYVFLVSALLYVSSHFVKGGDLNIVVFLHGWYLSTFDCEITRLLTSRSNCVANCVRARNDNSNCTPGQPKRSAYGIIDQLENSKVCLRDLSLVVDCLDESHFVGG
jgi:hypothetical protein